MMKRELATAVRPSTLESAIQDTDTSILLIDCRSFVDFNSSHIANAHNVYFPPIVKRRSGGTIPLANIVRCGVTRSLLMAGEYAMVVVYDGESRGVDDLPSDSVMSLVLKSLTDEADLQPLYFIEGGFRTFFTMYPHFCTAVSVGGGDTSPSSISHLQLLPVSMTTASHVTAIAAPACDACVSRECAPNGISGGRRDSAKMRRILLEQQDDPVQVLPWLYLGSVHHASRSGQLEELGVRALLNVSSVEYEDLPETICYKTIPVADSSNSDLSVWFPMAIEFIESVRQSNGKVLVHCQAGVSRSATICLAYLMYHKELGLEQAYDFLKARRSVIAPNLNFMQQLLQFEGDLNRKRNAPDAPAQDVSVTVEAPTPKPASTPSPVVPAMALALAPNTSSACAPKPCGYMFSFDSPLTPLASSPGFANCSPLVSPS